MSGDSVTSTSGRITHQVADADDVELALEGHIGGRQRAGQAVAIGLCRWPRQRPPDLSEADLVWIVGDGPTASGTGSALDQPGAPKPAEQSAQDDRMGADPFGDGLGAN